LDGNKFFLINRGDLLDRWDPIYNLFILMPEHSFKFQIQKLRKLLLSSPQYGANEQGIERKFNEEPRYIRITDIDAFGRLSNDLGVTARRIENQYLLNNNDLLIARSGNTVGKTYLHKAESINYQSFFAGYLIRFLIDPTLVSPDYIFYFTQLDYYKKWVNAIQRPTGQPNINAEEYKSLLIPIPDQLTQGKIIDGMKAAYDLRKEKEDKAKGLLMGIDEYILNELIVTLPEQDENTIENRMFKTSWQKLTGNRLDPKKYSSQSEQLISCIQNSKLRKVLLKSLIVHSIAGDWGFDENEIGNDSLYTKCLVIRATEFDNHFNLKIENNRVKYRLISKSKLKKLDIQRNDLLLEKSGGSTDQPVGRIAIIENDLLINNSIAFSNFIHKFRVNVELVLPEFLFCFLKTIHNIKLTDVMQSQTNGIRNLIMREYWNQTIILPVISKQKEIADTIYQMRAEAKQTEIEAQQGFEQTKNEIEKLILG